MISELTPKRLVGGAVVAIAIVLAFAWCRHTDAPLPAPVQFSVDSNIATRPAADSARHVASVATEHAVGAMSHVLATIARDSATAAAQVAAADTDARRADSLIDLATREARTQADSARYFRAAYDVATSENAHLRRANTALMSGLLAARDTLGAARDTLRLDAVQLRADSSRFQVDAHLIADLTKVAQRGDRCRIAHFFDCPTRTEVAEVVVLAIEGARVARNVRDHQSLLHDLP